MNLCLSAVGLSARRKINGDVKNFFRVFLMSIMLILSSVVTTSGQAKDFMKSPPQGGNEPKIDIKVNRHYDNKGNIIGYDSTYSSSYSNIQVDTIGLHSRLKNFDRHFDNMHPSGFDSYFDEIFFNDTTRGPDFLHPEFFPIRIEGTDFFEAINRQLDSLKSGLPRKDNLDNYKH